MKKVRQWIGAGGFIIGFCMMLWFCNRIFMHKDIKDIYPFYQLKNNSVDVICLGSSHAYAGFQPNILWEEYGVTSYVMGSSSQSIPTSYYLLKEALKYQKPKVVLLEGYFFKLKPLYVNPSTVHYATDGLRLGKAKLEMIDVMTDDMPEDRIPEYYFPFLLYHSRWNELEDGDFHADLWRKGAAVVGNVVPSENPGLAGFTPGEIPENARIYFEKIQALCEENGIALCVFTTPIHKNDEDYAKEYEEYAEVSLSVEKYLEKAGVPFFFYQKTNEPELDYARDFSDGGHLNAYGQKKLTLQLGKYLVDHYQLESHKDERGYRDWDTGYQIYLEHYREAEKKIEESLKAGTT